VAYNLQAGDYVKNCQQRPLEHENYTTEMSEIVKAYCPNGVNILDAGCGELTISSAVQNQIDQLSPRFFETDISLGRLQVGIKHYRQNERDGSVYLFQAFFELPFASNSFDIVFTTHALEPNGGQEVKVLQSCFVYQALIFYTLNLRTRIIQNKVESEWIH